MIRPARVDDLPCLQDIERAAGEAFRALAMDAVADDPPLAREVLAAYQRQGRAWVATDRADPAGRPVAYLLVDVVDDAAHVEQVSVHPRCSGGRLGGALLDEASGWAVRQNLASVTLTTFTHVPWNGPYYTRLGFRHVPEDELGEGLLRLREAEAAHGLDRWPRSVMRRAAC